MGVRFQQFSPGETRFQSSVLYSKKLRNSWYFAYTFDGADSWVLNYAVHRFVRHHAEILLLAE